MKKTVFGVVAAVFLMAATLFIPQKAEAIPAFARQTGMSCNACHFQHYPALNQFGRNFKAHGFTMVGGQSLIEGEALSIPAVLNASIVTKLRYQKTNGDENTGTNKGEFQFPDEAVLFLGGRVGEHVGFILESNLKDDNSATNHTFASFKMPIGFDAGPAHVEVVPFLTDAFGPQFSFEVLNTGAIRNIRTIEHRRDISAVQYVGLQGEAQGVGFVGYHDTGYVNYTVYQPAFGNSDVAPLAHYVRAVATPTVAGWDLGGGVQFWSGTVETDTTPTSVASPATPVYEKFNGWAVDAQAQGTVANFPVGVYLQYASAEGSESGEAANHYNSNANDETAFSAIAEVGVLPGRATVALGYRDGDTGAAANNEDNAITVAATYQLIQNVQLQIDSTWYNGDFYDLPANNENANGDQLTTLMLFAAF